MVCVLRMGSIGTLESNECHIDRYDYDFQSILYLVITDKNGLDLVPGSL